MIQIIPAVLEKTAQSYKETISKLNNCPVLRNNWVHIDFADNKFVQNETIKPQVTSEVPTDFKKEAHLMVAHPKDWIDKLLETGIKRIIFHIECGDDIDEVIDYIKSKGAQVGLAIQMDTPIEKLENFIAKIDVILVMSIVPGFQGQPFIPESLNRVKEISRLRSKGNYSFSIGVDGAVRDDNIKDIALAGADFVTVGSFLLKGDIEENLEKLWESILWMKT